MYTLIEMLVDGHGMTAQMIHALPECLIGGWPPFYEKSCFLPDNKCDLIVTG